MWLTGLLRFRRQWGLSLVLALQVVIMFALGPLDDGSRSFLAESKQRRPTRSAGISKALKFQDWRLLRVRKTWDQAGTTSGVGVRGLRRLGAARTNTTITAPITIEAAIRPDSNPPCAWGLVRVSPSVAPRGRVRM